MEDLLHITPHELKLLLRFARLSVLYRLARHIDPDFALDVHSLDPSRMECEGMHMLSAGDGSFGPKWGGATSARYDPKRESRLFHKDDDIVVRIAKTESAIMMWIMATTGCFEESK